MVCTTWDKQILRTFQGFFKDKLQFTRTKIYLINRHSLIPLKHWSRYWPKHVMESFTIFYFFGHTTFRNKTLQNNWVWLVIASEVQNSIWNKETEINYCSCTKMFSCYPWVLQVLIYTKDEPNFPQSNFTEKVVLCRQGCKFQGLFKT